MKAEPTLQLLIQDYFGNFLRAQKNVSPNTIASYRDAFLIFFEFAKVQLKKNPDAILLDDINAENVLKFTVWLEEARKNQPRTRNQRLAALRGFLNFVAFRVPSRVNQVSQVRMVPLKRHTRPTTEYLSIEEVNAIIAAPDQTSFSGARDFVLLKVMYNTGARVSEVVSMKRSDLDINHKNGSIKIIGKGRKARQMPLWPSTVKVLTSWLNRPELAGREHIFINRTGEALTRSGVMQRLEEAVVKATLKFVSLSKKTISPHTIRHTTAMHLLDGGVDITVIALWLGHSSTKTTNVYLQASLKMKEKALSHLQKPEVRGIRYKAVPSQSSDVSLGVTNPS